MIRAVLFTIAFVPVLSEGVSAGLVTFEFSGTVTDAAGLSAIDVGDTISGQYTFETTTPNFTGSPLTAIYVGAVTGWNSTLAGLEYFGSGGDIHITDWLFDEYYFYAEASTPKTGDEVDGFSLGFFGLKLRNDNDLSAITNSALDQAPLDPSAFQEERQIQLIYVNAQGDSRTVEATVDGLTSPATVPEPTSFAVFGIASLCWVWNLRRRRSPEEQAVRTRFAE